MSLPVALRSYNGEVLIEALRNRYGHNVLTTGGRRGLSHRLEWLLERLLQYYIILRDVWDITEKISVEESTRRGDG